MNNDCLQNNSLVINVHKRYYTQGFETQTVQRTIKVRGSRFLRSDRADEIINLIIN